MVRVVQMFMRMGLMQSMRIADMKFMEIFWLTPKGLELLKDKKLVTKDAMFSPLSENKLKHDHYVTDIRLTWESLLKIEQWIPERFLRNGDDDKIPDAVIIYKPQSHHNTVSISIEIENTQKTRSRYEKKFTDYQTGSYDLAFYFTVNETIRNVILEVSRSVKAEIVYTCSINEFLERRANARLVSYNHECLVGERFI